MRTKSTPWNRSYDLVKELRRQRQGGAARSKSQQNAKLQAQRNFIINHDKREPRTHLPEDLKTGETFRKARDTFEEQQLKRELKEVWE